MSRCQECLGWMPRGAEKCAQCATIQSRQSVRAVVACLLLGAALWATVVYFR